MKRIVVLGSTGSIGTQTLDVARRHADKLEVVALAAGTRAEELLAQAPDRCERIPMLTDERALKDADAWEAPDAAPADHPILRQDICGNFVNPDDYRISALNLSNAAAIVLYEALRQTGFPGM